MHTKSYKNIADKVRCIFALMNKIILLFSGQTIKYNGNQWRIHKNDLDSFPSDLHAHNDKGEKLNLYNGQVFNKRKYMKRLGNKTMRQIYNILIKNGEPEVIEKAKNNQSRITYLKINRQ